MDSNGLIKEIRSRIQFLITVEIFFSTMTYAFYKSIGGNETQANDNALFWGIGISFCIINYLMIGLTEEASGRLLGWVCNTISLNIVFFILPIIILALIVKNPVPGYYELPFKISFVGSILMPVVTFFLICGVIAYKHSKTSKSQL